MKTVKCQQCGKTYEVGMVGGWVNDEFCKECFTGAPAQSTEEKQPLEISKPQVGEPHQGIAVQNTFRVALKGLLYVVGGIAYFRGVTLFAAEWGWGSIQTVLAVFVPPISVFIAPIYEGFSRGSWTPALIFYSLFIVVGALYARFDDSKGKGGTAQK